MTKKKEHYVDNERFCEAMTEWKQLVIEAEAQDEPRPPISEYIGECFVKIAEHLSRKPNFINYPFRDEMIADGIENCLMYAHNFNPEKSKNPFSYFTQMIYYAFLRRIEKEKKQNYVKYKRVNALVFVRTPVLYLLIDTVMRRYKVNNIIMWTLILERWFFFGYKILIAYICDYYHKRKQKYIHML